MKYLIAIAQKDAWVEGLVCSENGIVLRKETAESGEAVFQLLTSAFPIQKAAVYLSDVPLTWPLPAAWRHSLSKREEMLAKSCLSRSDGYLLTVEAAALAVRKEGKAIRAVGGDYGSRFVYTSGMSLACTVEASTLCCLFEAATGLSKAEMCSFLEALPEQKRLSYARVVRQGCALGDGLSLQIRETACRGYTELLRPLLSPEDSIKPLCILGMQDADRQVVWKCIQSVFPNCFYLQNSEMPPLYGGVLGACALWHIRPDASFARRFLETYALYQ